MAEEKSMREQFWDPIAGFGVTFRTMFKNVVTEQYPFEKMPTAPMRSPTSSASTWTRSKAAASTGGSPCATWSARPANESRVGSR